MSTKDNENEGFFALACALFGMGAQEVGAEQFDRFVEIAKSSGIPIEFAEATTKLLSMYTTQDGAAISGRCFVDTCRHLLKVDLSPRKAEYMVICGQAIANTRSWLTARERLEQLESGFNLPYVREKLDETLAKIAEQLGCPKDNVLETLRLWEFSKAATTLWAIMEEVAAKEATLREVALATDELKRFAQRSCGLAVLIEERMAGPKGISFARLWHFVRQRLLKQIPTLGELLALRQHLESLCAKNDNRSRILLLSH